MRVSYEGDPDIAKEFVTKALQEMFRLETRMAVYGRQQGTFQHVLNDDTYCYGYSLPGGIRAVHIVAPPAPVEDMPLFTRTKLPDFVSGVLTEAFITEGKKGAPDTMSAIYPTMQSWRVHQQEFSAPLQANVSARLAVRVPNAFTDEFHPPDGSTVIYSQYTKLHPSMYSGKMRRLVQVLMGFGKLPKKSIYDGVKPRLASEEKIEREKAPGMSEWERVVNGQGRQVWYDYRFPRTHGIITAADKSLWLCEIGVGHGVCMMPLPLDPNTKDPKFRQKLINLHDEDGLAVLDEFGGFPTGESFGAGRAFEANIKAGRVVRALPYSELSRFYQCDAYSQSMGWAFNERGSEAHNTCWTWVDEDDIQRGLHFALNLSVSPNPLTFTRSSLAAVRLEFEPMRFDKRYQDVFEPNMFKLGRLSDTDYAMIRQMLASSKLEDVFAALDGMEGVPVATATATLSEVSRGRMFWGAKYNAPEIKFPDYLLGYVISHDMKASGGRGIFERNRCDTTLHVFFVGNELKWCKIFIDPTQAPTRREGDDPYDIQYNPVGDFSEVYTTGPVGIPAMVYTSEFDDRESLGVATQSHRYKRRDKGWISVGGNHAYGFIAPSGFTNTSGPLDPDFPDGGTDENHKLIIDKKKWFTYEHWVEQRNSKSLRSGVIVPMYERCGYYYAVMRGHGGGFDGYTWNPGLMSSPYIGHFYRETGQLLTMETQRFTENGSPWCNFWSIADEGDWVPHGSTVPQVSYGNDALWAVLAQNIFRHVPINPTFTLDVYLVASPHHGIFRTYTETRSDSEAVWWEPKWFLPSPDPDTGLTQYIQEMQNCMGEGDAMAYQRDVSHGEQEVRGRPSLPFMSTGPGNAFPQVNFVGVIDG